MSTDAAATPTEAMTPDDVDISILAGAWKDQQAAPAPHACTVTSASLGRACSRTVAGPSGVRTHRVTEPSGPLR